MESSNIFLRDPHAKRSTILFMGLMLAIAFICIFFIILDGEYIKFLIIPPIIFLPLALFYLSRKKMFGEISVSDRGISFIYKKQVLKEFVWQEIVKIEMYYKVIVFSKTKKAIKGIHHFNLSKNHMSIDLPNEVVGGFFTAIKKHLSKLPFTIDEKTMEKIDKYSNPSIEKKS